MTRTAEPSIRQTRPGTPLSAVATRAHGALGPSAEGVGGALALLGLVTGSAGVALAAAERPSFLAPPRLHGDAPWLAGPLAGLWPSLTDTVGSLRWAVTLTLLGMTACWVLAVACAPRVRLWGVGAAVLASVALLTLAPPFSLADTFNYLHYGRMLPLYGLNPYTSLPIQASVDPAYAYSTWHHLHSPYGPLFSLFTEALAPLSLPTAYWVLKIVIGLAALGVAVLTALLARAYGRDPARAVAFVSLNPLVLIYGVGGVHNDVLFMVLLLGGALLITKRFEVAGGTALACAAAIKLSAGLAIPIIWAGSRRRWRTAIGVAIGGVAMLVMVKLAFGGHLPDDATQQKLVASLSLPNLVGLAAGQGGLSSQLRGELDVVLVLVSFGLILWTWRTREWVTACAWAMVLLIVTLGWAMPWYVLWVLPFAAVGRRAGPRAAAIALTVFLLAVWVPATPPLLHRLGARPGATAVGRDNARFMQRLLK